MHKISIYSLLTALVLGVMFTAAISHAAIAADDPFAYQSLTNLGPRTSSRVLLLNNDTNPACPIFGQGYSNTVDTVEVGQTFWEHDGVQVTSMFPRILLMLLDGVNHVLYQKLDEEGGKKELWTLVNCRTGSSGYYLNTSGNGSRNYLPWSSTAHSLSNVAGENQNAISCDATGIKQVLTINMRCIPGACVYSPVYEDGIGEICFDVVNGWANQLRDGIVVEVATEMDSVEGEALEFSDLAPITNNVEKYVWKAIQCDQYIVTDKNKIDLPETNKNITEMTLSSEVGNDKKFFRVRSKVDYRGPIRFRIRRTSSASISDLDYYALILIDNIIVSYPNVKATLNAGGIDSQGVGKAQLGRVAAFTEPILHKSIEGAKPRMSFAADTDGQPPWVTPMAKISKAQCEYRWRYLNQAYGPWKTSTVENISSDSGTNIVWDAAIEVPGDEGDIEYSYSAWVTGTHYKFLDFALDSPIEFPDEESGETFVQCATNYFTRIREGVSPWEAMYVEAEIFTNAANDVTGASCTNIWTMELIADNTWRGFVDTRTNYLNKIAHIRFRGKNKWESGGTEPVLKEQYWYFPEVSKKDGEPVVEIPKNYTARTTKPADETDVKIDCGAGYLMFEFNDLNGMFLLNRAEYQNFNEWTPPSGQPENAFVGNYVNTSYVGRIKQTYLLDFSKWPFSRSTSPFWCENFDLGAKDSDYPFNEPFGDNVKTPNGWVANNGMWINGFFSATSNKTANGMALQLEGQGNGSIALIDPADKPNGIGTVSISARLAQYLEFGDFMVYNDGGAAEDYILAAKVAMTHKRQDYYDGSSGKPSVSMVAYYRSQRGCYEARITRIDSTAADHSNLFGGGKMRLEIIKWFSGTNATGRPVMNSKVLKSQVLSIGTKYNNSANQNVSFNNYLVPKVAKGEDHDDTNWSSMFLAVQNRSSGTYIEAGIAADASANNISDDLGSKMMSINITDEEDNRHTRGTYGVGSCECPAVFGKIEKFSTGAAIGSFCDKTTSFASNQAMSERDHINGGDWGIPSYSSFGRMESFEDYKDRPYGEGYRLTWQYGICAVALEEKLYLKKAEIGNSSNWEDLGEGSVVTLSSYAMTNLVFTPYILEQSNIKIVAGDKESYMRTDVVVDDIEVSQWRAEASGDINSLYSWAFTEGWIAGTTNVVANAGGVSTNQTEDLVALVSDCGYYVVTNDETDLVYVFTNTTAGALGDYATFVPRVDMSIEEVFILGGGGGGGPGGGGGGGGAAIWITNSVSYRAGEEGIRVYVGNGGGGGGRNATTSVNPSYSAAGGTSYVEMKNPIKSGVDKYQGYGGGRGGTFRNSYDAGGNSVSNGGGGGGSARKNATRANGHENCGSGFGGAAVDGAPGGGGGGGLRGLGVDGANASAPNKRSVISSADEYSQNGDDGIARTGGGVGGNGFPISLLGDSPVRKAIGDLLGDQDAWVGAGGGGGSGTNLPAHVSTWGFGALLPGNGGKGGGGRGGVFSDPALTYASNKPAGEAGKPNTGAGGGGGIFVCPTTSGATSTKNWILAGGKGGNGIVVMRVKVKDRFVLLQPMRGDPQEPMSLRTPFMNGLSMVSFSWKYADANAVLRVQVATNEVYSSTVGQYTTDHVPTAYPQSGTWTDICAPIRFADISEEDRAAGATNILIGIRAPACGVVRVAMDQGVVTAARAGTDGTYGMVAITDCKAWDEPEIDELSWWGWNIMPSYKMLFSYLYDPVDLGPGRSCTLNFSGKKEEQTPEYPFAQDPDDPNNADIRYDLHDPFVQTPRFTNGVGQISFKARVMETNLTGSAWITVSGCSNPAETNDTDWTVLTNIEITADTTIFKPYSWKLFTDGSTSYKALRLTARGARNGRNSSEAVSRPIERVIIDEVVIAQPMTPKVTFSNVRPFRHVPSSDEAISQETLMSSDEQPLLNESFGFQATVLADGMEEELDTDSIRVYVSYYTGISPWGWRNWQGERGATKDIELKQAEDWTPENMVYRSATGDRLAFVDPQMAGDDGYQVVQYHVYALFKNKNGTPCPTNHLESGSWIKPSWYHPTDFNKTYGGSEEMNFSAYTILDTISPKRAWFNEINMFDGNLSDYTRQYIEVAVPKGFDVTGWTVKYIQKDGSWNLYPLMTLGMNGVSGIKNENAFNKYSFIAVESPATESAGTFSGKTDGTWNSSAFDSSGQVDMRKPYALRLIRPTGIVEHEVVFMCTNTSRTISGQANHGTNFWKDVRANVAGDWIYAGADEDHTTLSLGVYTNHGESTSCWTNGMVQTPGEVNRFIDGRTQYIDPAYFEPPLGNYLWIYAEVDEGSANSVEMVFGDLRTTSTTVIVPQNEDGTFSTNIVYEVRKWFEMGGVTTNEGDNAAARVPEAEGVRGRYVLDLSNIRIGDSNKREFYVTAFTRDTSKIAELGANGISRDDPYYPAVVDWLQNFEEGDIKLAEYWRWNNTYVTNLTLKGMYWLDIPPTDGDWVFKGDFAETGGSAIAPVDGADPDGMPTTNIRVTVKMMITNATDTARIGALGHELKGYARKVDRLLGLDGSSSGDIAGTTAPSWTSVTFKVTGALLGDSVSNDKHPLRIFALGPDSWNDDFSAVIDIIDPFSKHSPGYSYGWSNLRGKCTIGFGWSIDERMLPMTVPMLNSNSTYKVTSP